MVFLWSQSQQNEEVGFLSQWQKTAKLFSGGKQKYESETFQEDKLRYVILCCIWREYRTIDICYDSRIHFKKKKRKEKYKGTITWFHGKKKNYSSHVEELLWKTLNHKAVVVLVIIVPREVFLQFLFSVENYRLCLEVDLGRLSIQIYLKIGWWA